MSDRSSPPHRLRWPVLGPALLLAALGLAYWLLAPATPNGDGLGYLRQLPGRELAPGHLGYLPLARVLVHALVRPSPDRALLDLVPALVALSVGCAVLALLLFYDSARRVGDGRHALFATALLGLSHAFFRSAQEVEVYAVSALLCIAALWALIRMADGPPRRAAGWATLAGVLGGLSVTFHLTLALLGASLLLLLWRWSPRERRLRCTLLGTGAMALVASAALLWALHDQGLTRASQAWAFLRSSDHGIPYPRLWTAPPIALWGIARSFVHVPYPNEASWLAVIGLTLLGAATLVSLFYLRFADRRRAGARSWPPPPAPASSGPDGPRIAVDKFFLAAWIAPLALFGILFYPSDTERWIFIMPALALLLAPASGRAGLAVLAVMAIANFFSVELPGARDDRDVRQAAAVDRAVRPGDLVISPGHGWDELLGLGTPAPARRMIMIYYAGAERSVPRAAARVHAAIDEALAGGGRVYVARLRDDRDHRGFKELRWLGMSPEAFAGLFEPYDPRPTRIPLLWQLRRR